MVRVPPGARPVARVLLISEDDRLLLFQGFHPESETWWVSPGGGLRSGESFEEAAARELVEETGISAEIEACVWTRHHRFEWFGKAHNQYERFFVARTGGVFNPTAPKPDGYIVGHRWWALDDIIDSSDLFSPRRLSELLPPVLRGKYPATPFDAGV